MPRGAKPGERRGGRSKGTPNKKTQAVQERLEELGCDPLELSALVAMGKELDGPHPKLNDFYKLLDKLDAKLDDAAIPDEARELSAGIRCLVDDHLTKGHVPPELRSKHITDLMQYAHPKRKPVDGDGSSDLGVKQGAQVILYIPDNARDPE